MAFLLAGISRMRTFALTPWQVGTLVALVLIACAGSAAMRATQQSERQAASEELKEQSPARSRQAGYVSSDACRACHPGEYSSWHRTYHRTMTQVASPTSVLGDFNEVSLEYFGRKFHLSRQGDEFWVSQEGGTAARVVQTTGSHHYQAYWVHRGQGNFLQNFPFVYLLDDQRWVRRNDVFMMPPEIGNRPESVLPWNFVCIRCHATHGQPRDINDAGHTQTVVAELGISCESCHGPAAKHVQYYSNPVTRYRRRFVNEADSKIVNPASCAHDVSSQICGQCHGVTQERNRPDWNDRGSPYRPTDELEATRFIARHPANTSAANSHMSRAALDQYFWNDGMVRVSGREYNGLIESPCYQQGELSCLSCHSMHASEPNDQIKSGMEGNQACTQCHSDIASRIESHTHHGANSTGSQCYNCHMPHTTYGLIKAIRSHEIESPDVAVTIQTGRPHACNLCHLDKSLGWTADHMRDWYGHQPPALTDEQRDVSAALLHMLKGDAGQRAIVAWHVGWQPALAVSGSDWAAPFVAELLNDPYSVVRYIAHRSLRALPGFADFEYDYVADSESLRDAVSTAKSRWQNADTRSPTILIGENGSVMSERVGDIMRLRDDRPLDLLE